MTKHIDAKAFAQSLPEPTAAFAADTMAKLRALADQEEVPPVKRKVFSTILIAALLMALLAATALAAYTLTRSKEADAIARAKQALSEKYGLTPEMLGMFYVEERQDGGGWTVMFYSEGYPPLLGDYTVQLAPQKEPEATWTHDDVDPANWKDGSLEASVWGQLQIRKALHDPEAADAAYLAKGLPVPAAPERNLPPTNMPELKEGEYLWNGEIIRDGTPGPDDITHEAAREIAIQAIMEESAIPKEVLAATESQWDDFSVRDTGNPMWGLSFRLTHNDVFQDWGVLIDARTGKVMSTNVITGATP